MVDIPQPGQLGVPPFAPEISITVEAPMAFTETLQVVIQQTNQPQQLPSHPNRQATIHALASNSAAVYMGNSSVNANSFPLNPGAAQDVHVDNLNKVYLFGTKGDVVVIEVEWGIGAVE